MTFVAFSYSVITISDWEFEHAGHGWVLVDVSDLRSGLQPGVFVLLFGGFPLLLGKFALPFLTLSLDLLHGFVLFAHLSLEFGVLVRVEIATSVVATSSSSTPTNSQPFDFFLKLTDKFLLRTFVNDGLILNLLDLVSVAERGQRLNVIVRGRT